MNSTQRKYLLQQAKMNGCETLSANEAAKTDKRIVLAAVKERGFALYHASEMLKHDREVVLAAVETHGGALRYASEALKNDREVVLAAIRQCGNSNLSRGHPLQHASIALRNDKDFMLDVVRINGNAMRLTPLSLKYDRDIILAAYKENEKSLQYALSKEVVSPIVKKNGLALKFAPKRFQNDKDVVVDALTQNYRAIEFVSKSLQSDLEVLVLSTKQMKKSGRESNNSEVRKVINMIISQAKQQALRTENKSNAIQLVSKFGLSWEYGMEQLIGDCPGDLKQSCKITGLYPFMSVAASDSPNVGTIFNMMKLWPELINVSSSNV